MLESRRCSFLIDLRLVALFVFGFRFRKAWLRVAAFLRGKTSTNWILLDFSPKSVFPKLNAFALLPSFSNKLAQWLSFLYGFSSIVFTFKFNFGWPCYSAQAGFTFTA